MTLMARCLAAPYAQLLMKQVISTVVREVDLRPTEPRLERPRKSAIAFVPHRHARVVAKRRARRPLDPIHKRSAALLASLLVCVGLAACGGGKTAGTSKVAASATTTPPTSTRAFPEPEYPLDADADNDNPGKSYYDTDDYPVLRFGHAAGKSEERTVTDLVRRYYNAAVAQDGGRACALMDTQIAEAIVEQDEGGTGGQGNTTCATAASRLFREHHRKLVTEFAKLEVKNVRVDGERGWVLLAFRSSRPSGRLLIHREGSEWKIAQALDLTMS